MTSITWASPRYVQELTTILGPQNRTQGSCELQCSAFCIVCILSRMYNEQNMLLSHLMIDKIQQAQ